MRDYFDSICYNSKDCPELDPAAILKKKTRILQKFNAKRTSERRMLSDAAWHYIEAHLEHFVELYEKEFVNSELPNTAMWSILIGLREQREKLAQELQAQSRQSFTL